MPFAGRKPPVLPVKEGAMQTRSTMGIGVSCLVAAAIAAPVVVPTAHGENFDEFKRRDRAAYEAFLKGKAKDARAGQPARTEPEGRTPREQATWLVKTYRQLERELNAPYVPDDVHPAWIGKGGFKAMKQERESRLYPNGKFWRFFDSLFWFGSGEKAKLLDDIEKDKQAIISHGKKLASVVAKWNELGFGQKVGPLEVMYGMTVDKKWDYEKKEFVTGTFDLLAAAIESTWPPGGAQPHPPPPPPAGTQPPGGTTTTSAPVEPDTLGDGTAPEGMAEEISKPPPPPPPVKTWDEMTPAERHQALKRNDPEAWKQIGEMLLGTDAKECKKDAAQVKEALGTSDSTKPEPPPPAPAAAGKPWNEMTVQERHDALKRGDKAAWLAARDALLSGDGKRVDAVVAALSTRPVPADVVAFAYVAAYKLAQVSDKPPGESNVADFGQVIGLAAMGAIVEKFMDLPPIREAVEQGKADGLAGRDPKYKTPSDMTAVLAWIQANAPPKPSASP
jgi:hypothetical protein